MPTINSTKLVKRSPKRVVISGYYGFGSIGDEAILLSMVDSFRGEMADVEIVVLSDEPFQTKSAFGVEAISRTNPFKIIGLLRHSDMFISGGGGLLQDIFKLRSVIYYGGLIVLARLLGLQTMVYAQGIGPLNRKLARTLTRWTFSFADLITVRDPQSKKLLQEIGVKKDVIVTADPAFALKPISRPPSGAGNEHPLVLERMFGKLKKPVVGIAVRDWEGADLDKFALVADKLIEKLSAMVVFIPMKYPNDLMTSKNIADRMDNDAKVFEFPSSKETMEAIGELDFLIGIPLHSLVMAAKQSVPFMAILYDPKVDNFLKLIGHEPPLPLEGFDVDEVVDKVKLSLDKKSYGAVDDVRMLDLEKEAQRNVAMARELLCERKVLGLHVDALNSTEALSKIEQFIGFGGPHTVVTLNTEIATLAQSDEELFNIINQSDLVLPDSVGIKWAARLRKKVPGIELIEMLCELAVENDYSVAFFGGEEGVAEKAANNLAEKYEGLKVNGCYCGYYSDEEEEIMADMIRRRPDILFVGLGAPKQEKWISKNVDVLDIPVAIGVGGSFDVLSGKTKRAPIFIQKLNLEWLYRLCSEPGKRFKRTISSLPKFVWKVLRSR